MDFYRLKWYLFTSLLGLNIVWIIATLWTIEPVPQLKVYSIQTNVTTQRRVKPKTILVYPRPSWYGFYNHIGVCDYKCRIVFDKEKYINKVDAIIWVLKRMLNEKLPRQKRRGQVWVLFTGETPYHVRFISDTKRLINYTLTFRRDSDLPIEEYNIHYNNLPYDNSPLSSQWEETVQNKSKMIAWLVSNCKSRTNRVAYVNQIQKYLPIDIFGSCGPYKCRTTDLCHRRFTKKYKFYLAFENSYYADYITEKLFLMMSNVTIVPIVRGAAIYELYLPKGSFIDAMDFKNPKQFSRYIRFLMKNHTAYLEYYRARKHFTNLRKNYTGWGLAMKPYCELCKRLYNQSAYRRFYEDLPVWWRGVDNTLVKTDDIFSKRKDFRKVYYSNMSRSSNT